MIEQIIDESDSTTHKRLCMTFIGAKSIESRNFHWPPRPIALEADPPCDTTDVKVAPPIAPVLEQFGRRLNSNCFRRTLACWS